MVISDEVYEKIVYDGTRHWSIAALEGMGDRTITINSLSKTYAMTGWRVGYATGRSDLIKQMIKMNLFTNTCANTIAQRAAIAALTGPQGSVERMVQEYAKRRDLMVKGLNEIGLTCVRPKGAFYAFPRIGLRDLDSYSCSMFLLEESHVSTVPGSSFGERGEGYMRLSYATSRDNIRNGLERIMRAMREAERKEP
jgi:aminotransferase